MPESPHPHRPQQRLFEINEILNGLGIEQGSMIIHTAPDQKRYRVVDFYCVNPACSCSEIMMAILPQRADAPAIDARSIVSPAADGAPAAGLPSSTGEPTSAPGSPLSPVDEFDNRPMINFRYDFRHQAWDDLILHPENEPGSSWSEAEGRALVMAIVAQFDAAMTSYFTQSQQLARVFGGRLQQTASPPVQTASRAAASHKTGRNEPCPCGSGRKYKQCCGQAGTAPVSPAPIIEREIRDRGGCFT